MKIIYVFIYLMLSLSISLEGENTCNLVYPGVDGKLVYIADYRGNTIIDFSRAGYMGGGVSLPEVSINEILYPIENQEDDTDRIQEAIDKVSCMTPVDGFRGAILLKRGVYRVAKSLKITASGIVLRGEGQDSDDTVLLATGKERRTLINIGGELKITEAEGSRRRIADSYVPWGTLTFSLESTEGFSVGDQIIIYRPSTTEWIHEIKMDRIKPRKGTKQWQPGSKDLKYERIITSIDGNTITLDAPVINAMEDKYGGGHVVRYQEEGRINQSGVENLRLISTYEKGKEDEDEDHAWTGIDLDNAANSWVRNVTIVHFARGIDIHENAIFITIQDCAVIKPVSGIRGRRRYPFPVKGQYCLVQRCYSSHARHAAATGSTTCGPNVFLDCLAEDTYNDTGPHQRWAAGILWDNLKGGGFNVQDRGNWGTGQGWAGAQQVFWNCETSSICIQKPPTAQNYAIGCTGEKSQGRFKDRQPGHYESHGTHVVPRSLFLKQLEDRLGTQAVENVTIEEQRNGTIFHLLKRRLYQ
ncbi:MAG: hypothetical protein JSW07_22860 [bacterium]|nr:MAG: hypothetical protein JSW07_22860 [bacterium]